MSTEPNKKLLSDPRVPRITLDDQDWPIPKLAPAQLEIVLPLIDEVKKTLREYAPGAVIDADVIHKLGTILCTALQKGHPDLTRDEFDQMPIGLSDLIDALPLVQKQSGCFRPAKPHEVNGVSDPLARAPQSSPTG